MNTKQGLNIFIASVLVFCTVSFLSFLSQIPPFKHESAEDMDILSVGFPWKFYGQFWIKHNNYPNFGWEPFNFIYDYITVLITIILFNLLISSVCSRRRQ